MSTWMIVRGPRSGATGSRGASGGVDGGRRLGVMPQAVDLVFEEADAIHELLERPREGIRQIHLVEVDLPVHALAIAGRDPSWHSDHHRVGRDLPHDHGARTDPASRADGEAPEDP